MYLVRYVALPSELTLPRKVILVHFIRFGIQVENFESRRNRIFSSYSTRLHHASEGPDTGKARGWVFRQIRLNPCCAPIQARLNTALRFVDASNNRTEPNSVECGSAYILKFTKRSCFVTLFSWLLVWYLGSIMQKRLQAR